MMQDTKHRAELYFLNKVLDKKQLKDLISWVFRNYGVARAANMADQLKKIGFSFATQAGISLSIEDLRIPEKKRKILEETQEIIKETENRYYRGDITIVERFQKVIDTWNNASENLKQEVIEYFKQTDPLNPVYMMAFSGARGNISQVRQLVGMRGLMSDPQGQIIDLPIASNFREGLTVTEYFISSYGARKGLVDTALRTADSGYLTRRLVDVAQDVIIREIDCQTQRGILLESMIDNNKTLIPLEISLIGRILAEDLYDPQNGKLIGTKKQDINEDLAKKIIKAGITKVLVRSPLACQSHGSICQYCYGWNLAHGKLIDLGEAIGIIAAQSIGEPGTQLTMRTFHTGGVFTGELANQIQAPMSGTITYPESCDISLIRTTHGDQAFLLNSPATFKLLSDTKVEKLIHFNKNDILFFKNQDHISVNKTIAESPVSKRLSKEKAQKYLTTDLSGQIYFDNLEIKETDKKDYISRTTKNHGLIWILSGQVYNIPDFADLIVKPLEKVNKGDILATIKFTNQLSGYVQIKEAKSDALNYKKEISIINESVDYPSLTLVREKEDNKEINILKLNNEHKFKLNIEPKSSIVDYQNIATLMTDNYKTKTGGIIKFLNLPVSKRKIGGIGINKDAYEILGPGYILWISEETHSINKEIGLILVKDGEYIEEGTEICKNIFCKTSGVIELIKKDEIIKEIIIKPGKLYPCKPTEEFQDKKRGFLRPGEKLYNQLTTEKLVYWERVDYSSESYILIRSVTVFSITEKTLSIGKEFGKYPNNSFDLEIAFRTPFKDGERIKSINGIEIVTIELITKVRKQHPILKTEIEFFSQDNIIYYPRLLSSEQLSFKEVNTNDRQGNYVTTKILVTNNDFVNPNTIIAQTEIMCQSSGTVENIPDKFAENRRIIITTEADIKEIHCNQKIKKFNIGDWIKLGDEISHETRSTHSGKIIGISENSVRLKLARPYLISSGSILYVNNNDLVQRGENLAVLIFERSKTGDIVQGLPRIEEILEARKKNDSPLNPHELLEQLFAFYTLEGLQLNDAARLSLQDIQQILVNEIQVVYQSQGVDISDKHIEVIVRQMTNKVQIEQGGDSNFLPGEIIDLHKIENINKNLELASKKTATYFPILMGITKASLNTDSFISAASFQETTKVLTEAAMAGKLDWLKGLKENVIIGRLIPAGTGFDLENTLNIY
uniref:RNA polymerase beta'' subunit n=1 Tax=Porphyridium aerugineum TaxID=2792 RepID=UPI001FCE02E6|nr:RNA polymerase beta'' subunit [Porphyridium aerugineum]UNJ17958.1 RNA polymerase beta'' subunit [Porphyridium aerugineum]